METNFNFKSQVCTDKNQSEPSLDLKDLDMPEVTFENSPMEVELTLKVQNYESMDSKRF